MIQIQDHVACIFNGFDIYNKVLIEWSLVVSYCLGNAEPMCEGLLHLFDP